MSNIFKKLGAFALVLAMVVSLAGCGVTITSIELPGSLDVNVGDTVDAAATFAADKDDVSADKLADAVGKLELTWTSADESVAIVDANGAVTGVAGGETTITVATTDGKLSASVKVNVKVPLEDVDVEDIELTTLDKDEAIAFELVPDNAMAEDIEFAIADEAVATVEDGKITAIAAGETELTITVGDITKTVKVKVLQAPVELGVMSPNVKIEVGKTAEIVVTTGLEVEADVGIDYTFKTADEKVATVDENGNVTGVTVGETEIIVTNELGQSCKAKVEVVEPAKTSTGSNRPTGNTGNTGSSTQGTQGTTPGTPTSGGGSGGNGGDTQTPSNPSPAPAPTPTPTPAGPEGYALGIVCTVCGGSHHRADCPNVTHYHGNGTDRGNCPACGAPYGLTINIDDLPTGGDATGGE